MKKEERSLVVPGYPKIELGRSRGRVEYNNQNNTCHFQIIISRLRVRHRHPGKRQRVICQVRVLARILTLNIIFRFLIQHLLKTLRKQMVPLNFTCPRNESVQIM